MSRVRVVLWRHGQTDFNLSGRFQGQSDSVLTETGREQARAAAALIARELEPGASARIVSSDLVRAADTAAQLGALLQLPVRPDPALREVSFGEWEGLTREEVGQRWPEQFSAWRAGADTGTHGGESRADAGLRAARAILGYAEGAETLVVAAHGGVLRAAAAHLLGLDAARSGMLAVLGNAAWGVLDRRADGSWQLRAWNRAV